MSINQSKQSEGKLTKSRLADLPMEIIGLIAEQDLETAHNMYYTYGDEFPYLKKVYEKILAQETEKAENALNNIVLYYSLSFYKNLLGRRSLLQKSENWEKYILPFKQIILLFRKSERKYGSNHKNGFTMSDFVNCIEDIVQHRIVSGRIMARFIGFKGSVPAIEIIMYEGDQ